jgi:uncharacterized protein (DUF1810 family)
MDKLSVFKKYHNGKGKLMDGTNAPSFRTAMKELNNVKGKQSHWSWYIIPTTKGSRQFNDTFRLSPKDAVDYLSDTTLREHYVHFMLRVAKRLDEGMHPRALLMSTVDVRKTYDSAVLFKRVSKKRNDMVVYAITEAVIARLKPYMNERPPMAALFADLRAK